MAEENNQDDSVVETPITQQEVDPVKNLKSEFNRKLDNINEQLARQNAEILARLEAQTKTPAAPQKKLSELMYEDQDQFAAEVAARATAQVNQVLSNQAEMQNTLSSVIAQYPEFANQSHEATKRAIEISRSQPRGLAGTAAGNKMAMLEAASELGLVPTQHRSKNTGDDFSLAGGGGGRNRQSRQQKETEVSQETLDWARLLGTPVDSDPKRLEGLKKATQRKTWNRYK